MSFDYLYYENKKMPTTPEFNYNISNEYKMFSYDYDLMGCGKLKTSQQRVTEDVYYTYNTLVDFNNSLDKRNDSSFEILDKYLREHEEIKQSDDRKCINYYDNMYYWFNSYTTSPSEERFKKICDEIQQLMKYLERQGIVKESGCNLKRNYLD